MLQKSTAFIFLLAAHLLSAQTVPARIEWQTGIYGNEISTFNGAMITADLDGDGQMEIVTSGRVDPNVSKESDFFYVLHYTGSQPTYAFKAISRVYFATITALAVYNFDQQGEPEIFVGFQDGTVKVFDGKTLQEMNSFRVASAKPDTTFNPNRS